MREIGVVRTQVGVIGYDQQPFTHKLTLHNVESYLADLGMPLRRVETREGGRNTTLALRCVLSGDTDRLARRLPFVVALKLIPNQQSGFTHKVALGGLEDFLESIGVYVDRSETRAFGQGSELAIRVALDSLAPLMYTVILRRDDEGTWLADVPALIGCHTFGGTREQAILNAREAIEGCIQSLRASGDPLPVEDPLIETVIVSVS